MIKRLQWLYSQLLLGVLLLCSASIHAQQTHLLLDPVGAGGFELGDTFESNGWTVINETQTNKWVLGAIPQWFAGNRGAYISNDATTNANAYTVTSASRVHFYRDITFPTGTESVTISLDASMAGEGNWDNILVYLADTNVVPSSVGPTSSTMSSYTSNVTTIASQMTNPAITSSTLNPTWPNYTNEETGFFLDAVLAIESGSSSPQTQTNLIIQLTDEQVQYVSNNTKRLIITWKNDSSGGAQAPGSVDNIKVEAFVPACYMVDNLSTSTVTSDSFVATWTPDLSSSGYVYEIRTSGEAGSGSEGLVLAGTLASETATVNVNNLSGNTTYSIYVKKNCSTELGTSNWRKLNVTTLCGISGYFLEDFETTATNGTSTIPVVPTCWGAIDTGAGYVYVTSGSNYESGRGLAMNNNSDDTGEYLLVSPETNNLGNGGARIRFRAKTTSTSTDPYTTLKVVTLSNQDNLVGMVDLQTINLTTEYSEFVVNLPTGTNDFFAFKHGLGATSRLIYIDDVYYEAIPACSSPTSITINSVGVNSVTVSYPVPVGLPTSAQLEYEIRTSGEPGSGSAGLTLTGFAPTFNGTFTVNELAHSTNYVIYVRSNCGEGAFDGWRQVDFVTLCGVYTSIDEDFDTTSTGSSTNPTLPLCWFLIDEGAGSGYVSTSADYSAPNGFLITNSSDTSGNYILVSPETNNLGNGSYRVRFRAKKQYVNEATTIKFVTLSAQNNVNTITEIETITLTGDFEEYIVYLPQGTNDYFGFKHQSTSTSSPIYIDDVIYEPIPSCVEVTDFNVDMNLSNSSAILTWGNPNLSGLVNNFEIQYGLEDFELGSGTTVTATGTSKIIPNFVIGETYEFYIRRICSETDKSAWVGPFTLDFDYCSSIPTSNDNSGISSFTMGATTFPITDVTYVNLLNETPVALNSQDQIISSITFATGYTYDTHIWIDFNKDGVFNNENEKVYTGVSAAPNPSVLDTSFPINDVYATGEYRMRVGTADSGQSNPNSCYSGSYGVTIDLKVNITFPCLDPVNVQVSEITSTSAILTWEAAGSNYTIEYGPQGFQQGSGTLIENVNSPFVLDGLVEATNYSFYVKQICVDGQSEWSVNTIFKTLCGTPAPEGEFLQTLVEDDPVSMIDAVGQDFKYYLDYEMTQPINADAILTEGYYYITQTIGCESDLPLTVFVTLIDRIDEPILSTQQEFCGSAQISDIQISAIEGATVNWYNSLTSTEVLNNQTNLVTGTYYVNQSDGVTTSHRVAVNIVINQIPVNLLPTNILVCGYSSFANLDVNKQEGAQVNWYTSLTSNTPITNTQQAETGAYYVSQSFGICESERVLINVVAYDELPSPIAAVQTFCGSGVVSDLVAQSEDGAQLKWYSSSNSSTELTPNTQLVSGTYFVEQTKNGCTSSRRSVAVRVVSMSAPVVDAFNICGSGSVSDLFIPSISGVTYKWYNNPLGTELSQNTVLTSGTYYVSRVQYGCESAKSAVQVTILGLPNAPTGVATQTFVEGSTVDDLVLNQDNVTWYISSQDSQDGVNPLASNMPLVNGTTYYAVIIGPNGCPSLPFAVTVSVYLSNNEFEMDGLKYYPNPVSDVLNVDYIESIKSVEIYNLLGKRVKVVSTDSSNIQIDLSNLASGTYMIQLKTESKTQFIKVIKK